MTISGLQPEVGTSTATVQADTAAFRRELAARLSSDSVDLPMLPSVATRVVELSRSPDDSAASLAALLHQDPALAGHVLRIANSPAYLPRSPIVSLQQAVAFLGFQLLSEIAMVALMQTGVFRVRSHENELRYLWRHSLASGGFAREIARLKRISVDNSFLCGLLHAIGKPVVLQEVAHLEAEHQEALAPEVVFELLDEFHVEIGIHLGALWKLPPPIQKAISSYARVDRDVDVAPEAVQAAVADGFATHLLAPETLDEEKLRNHPGLDHLNLYPEDVDVLLEKSETILTLVQSMSL